MTQEELNVILDRHENWLKVPMPERMMTDTDDARRADLIGQNLSRLNFMKRDLRYAFFNGARLSYARFSGADCGDAIFNGADLRHCAFDNASLINAELMDARIWETCFVCADMQNAHLSCSSIKQTDFNLAKLISATFRETTIISSSFQRSVLRHAVFDDAIVKNVGFIRADLRDVFLGHTNIIGTAFRGCDFKDAKIEDTTVFDRCCFYDTVIPYNIPMVCPETGAFIGWKKCHNNRIVKLLIPESALRSSATGRKCRCNEAQVLEITSLDGKESYTRALSIRDAKFIYKVGETVRADNFDTCRFNECASGIHFFITRDEAVHYDY